jgi:multiple sugar transport system substrate-binding protein
MTISPGTQLSESLMTRRRLMSLLAAGTAVGAVPALSACGSPAEQGPSEGNVDLTMTVWGGKPDETTYKERLALAKQKFPNINVKLEITPDGGAYADKLSTAIAGGKGPDILELAEHTPAFASKNQILPLDDYIAKDGLDLAKTFGPTVPQIFKYEDKQYAIPDRSGAMVLYYNKAMFDKAGVKYPTAEWTWDDLLSAAQKLTIRQGAKTVQWGFCSITWWPYWMTFMYQNGGRLLDGDKPVVNSAANVEALQWYVDLALKHHVAPTPRELANLGKDIGPDQLFAQGKLAMEITGFWNLAALASVKGVDWDVAPLWRGKEQATSAFFNGLAVSRTSKHPADAWKVINFLASEAGQRPIIDNAEDCPANVQVQSSEAFLKPKWATKQVNMQAFGESAPFIYVPPLTPKWNAMIKVFDDNMPSIMSGQKKPQAALDEIQKRLEDVMAQK